MNGYVSKSWDYVKTHKGFIKKIRIVNYVCKMLAIFDMQKVYICPIKIESCVFSEEESL